MYENLQFHSLVWISLTLIPINMTCLNRTENLAHVYQHQKIHIKCNWQWRIQGGGTQGTFPPLELSNALLLGRGLAVATYISLTSHLLPPESRLLASYTTH